MAKVEALLMYQPGGLGLESGSIAIGKTSAPQVLRVLRDRLVEEAAREVEFWREVDPGLAGMKQAEAGRLSSVLEFLLSDVDLEVELRLVPESQ